MAVTDKLFVGSIPQLYDEYLVPAIFQPYAAILAERVLFAEPQDVLETACGTGVLTQILASDLPATVSIVATDLNQPMLDRAAAKAYRKPIAWRQADAQALPFEDGSFDVVVCQFGAMFFPDRVQAYNEARRVLRPGGQFLLAVWDRIAENEFADVVTQALAEIFPDDPPRFMARIPHGYHDRDRIRQELAAAGFSPIAMEAVEEIGRAASPQDPAIGLCQGTPLRAEIEARDASRLEEATDHAAAALAKRFGSGPIAGRIRAFIIAASR
jgi:ubiquinone/menaquinone biosynthesis C-methylase UbiE